jgi:hypothetical protein
LRTSNVVKVSEEERMVRLGSGGLHRKALTTPDSDQPPLEM